MRGGGREIEGFVFVAVFLIGDESRNYVFTHRITPEGRPIHPPSKVKV